MHVSSHWDGQGLTRKFQETSVVDNRAVQALQPVITLNDLHKKLTSSNIKERQADGTHLYSSLPSKLGEAAKQATLTAGIINSSATNPDVPEGLTPETWAALQKTAKELDVKGIFDCHVNQLRSKMLQQVKLYRASQAKQQQTTAAKAGVNGLPGKRAATPLPVQQTAAALLAGRLEASCQQVIASLPVQYAKRSHTAASLLSATSGITHHIYRTNRTVRARSHQRNVKQESLQETVEVSSGAYATGSQQARPQPPPTLQLQRSRRPTATGVAVAVPAADETGGVTSSDTPGSPLAAAALAGLSARTSSTAEAVVAWQLQNQQVVRVSSNQSSCRCVAGNSQQQLHVKHLPGCSCAISSARSGTASTASMTHRSSRRQQAVAVEAVIQETQQVTHRQGKDSMHHCRTRQRKQDKTLAECVAAIAVEDRPSSPVDDSSDSAAANIQRRLSPAACEAFQTAVAVAVDSKLKLYRDRAQQARQHMLQRELLDSHSPEQQKQQQGQLTQSAATPGQESAACGHFRDSGSSITAGPGGVTAAPTASIPADVALLTMQQLVALLAKRDAEPEVQDQAVAAAASVKESTGQQQEQPVLTKTAAASQKLALAKTVAEIIAAADEHVAAASQELTANRNLSKPWQKQLHRGSNSDPNSSRGTSSAVLETAENIQCPQRPASCTLTPPPQTAPGSNADVKAAATTVTAVTPINSCAIDVGSGCIADAAANKRASSGGFAGARLSAAGDPAGHVPAGMKLPPPKLQAPSEQEMAVLPIPSLPDLLDLSHEPAKVLQARLDRVWGVLEVPPDQQMKMVLSYTSWATAATFEEALGTWETAAAAVLQREGILQQLMQLRATMQAVKQQQAGADHRRASQDVASSVLGLDISQIHQLLWAFLAATEQVRRAAQHLQESTGQPLLVKRVTYPPAGAIISADQLQPILNEAWSLLGHEWVPPN